MEPSYKATISDLLTPEQYTKASGLAQISGSEKYLISFERNTILGTLTSVIALGMLVSSVLLGFVSQMGYVVAYAVLGMKSIRKPEYGGVTVQPAGNPQNHNNQEPQGKK